MATIDVGAVVALLGRELTDDEEVRAVTLLELAEGVVEDALPGFSVATGTATDETLDSWWLDRYPVSAVSELAVNGSVIDADRYTVSDEGEIRWLFMPAVDTFEWNLTWPATLTVTASYTFGFDPPPYSIVHEIAASVAATIRRQAANPNGVLNETLGAYSVGYGAAQQEALAAGLIVNIDGLKRWKRTRQTSVALIGR